MTRWRGFPLKLIYVLIAACLALGALNSSEALTAHASGVGPCSPLTAHDLAQPQVTAQGEASAYLSRSQGTDSTLLSLTGSGWPANTTIGMDIWGDHSGQFMGGPIYLQARGAPVIPLQGATSASGALQFPRFRLPSGFSGLCQMGMSVNGHRLGSVTMLFVVHTLDGNYSQGRIRRPILFTYLAPPTFGGAQSPTTGYQPLQQVHVGDTMTSYGGGWAPGERLTITTQTAVWPNSTNWAGGNVPVNIPSSRDDRRVTADSAGRFTFTYTIPQVSPLTYISLLIHGNDARYGDISFYSLSSYVVMPVALPSFTLDRATVTPGGIVTVTGFNWQPGQQGVIEYCRGVTWDTTGSLYCNPYATQSLGAFQADNAGSFVTHVRLPGNARIGDITLQARVNGADALDSTISAALAKAESLTIVSPAAPLTWAQLHPRQAWLSAMAPTIGGAMLVALATLLAMLLLISKRRRGSEQLDV